MADQKPSARLLFLPHEILLHIIGDIRHHVDCFCFAMTCYTLFRFIYETPSIKCDLPLWKKFTPYNVFPRDLYPQLRDLMRRMGPETGERRLCQQYRMWKTTNRDSWLQYLTWCKAAERHGHRPG